MENKKAYFIFAFLSAFPLYLFGLAIIGQLPLVFPFIAPKIPLISILYTSMFILCYPIFVVFQKRIKMKKPSITQTYFTLCFIALSTYILSFISFPYFLLVFEILRISSFVSLVFLAFAGFSLLLGHFLNILTKKKKFQKKNPNKGN